MTHAITGLTADEFILLLGHIPWLENLGRPHSRDSEVVRIRDPEKEWPGPENVETESLGIREGIWRDLAFRGLGGAEEAELEGLFQRAYRLVVDAAGQKVPYDPEQDSWYWPNAAVCTAAYVAAVIACDLHRGQPIPAEALRLWYWLAEGHWPCQYASVPANWDDPEGRGSPGRFVVL